MKMKFRFGFLLLVAMLLPATAFAGYWSDFSSGYNIVAASMGFGANNDIRGVAYDPTEDYLVVCEDDGNQAAVLNRSDGSLVVTIANVDTGDGTVDPFRVGVSDDGMIFTQGFAGSVKMVGDATPSNNDAAAAPIVVNSASYGFIGSSRSLFVTGDYSAGTCSILSSRGATLAIFQQDIPLATSTFVLNATIATGFASEPHGIWAKPDLSEIWAYRQGEGSRTWVGSVGSYTQDTSRQATGNWEYSVFVDMENDCIAVTGGHGGAGGYIRTVFARYSYTGWATAIGPGNPPTSAGVYDYTFNAANGAGDNVIVPSQQEVYVAGNGGVLQILPTISPQPSSVLVDQAAGIDNPPTQYTTVAGALESFDENLFGAAIGGLNSGDAAVANIIDVSGFGPYDERGKIFGDGVWNGITDLGGFASFTIRQHAASTDTPLILSGGSGASGACWIVGSTGAVTFQNVVFAASPNYWANDDFFFLYPNDGTLNLDNCVLTALPASATAYTSIADITPELLDGTAPYDAGLIRTGDNGFWTGVYGDTSGVGCVLNATNTVITNQGPDTIVAYGRSIINLNEGCKLTSGSRMGIQSGDAFSLNIAGTLANPVVIADHATSDGIRNYYISGGIAIDHCLIDGNAGGLAVYAPSGPMTGFSVSNTIFSHCPGVGFDMGDGGATGLSISNCTFYDNDTGLWDWISEPGVQSIVSVTDCIFAGAGTTGADISVGAPNVTFSNCAFVTAGPDVLSTTMIGGDLVTFSPALLGTNPSFESTAFSTDRDAPDWFLAVNNLAYQNAASGGGWLTGGGVQGPNPTDVEDWTLY